MSARPQSLPRLGLALAALGVLASVRLAFAQCPDGTPPPCVRSAAPPARSVAVLTFDNVSRDTSAQYLAEGLADQIATRLGRVERITVVSRTSVRRLREPQRLSVQQLGRGLNAAYLVSGSIRAAGGRVRVNVEALRATTGEVVWSDAFDRASDDIIGIEEGIATEVATGVAGRLGPEERRALRSRATASSRAYEQFLRGNVLLARRTPAAMQGAIASYRAATAADPQFADAFARLAEAYALYAQWGFGERDSLLALAREATVRALQLDPRSSDAWMGRGHALYVWSGITTRADNSDSVLASLAAFRRAVELNPRNDEAWHQYGAALRVVNDSAGIASLRRALALDPARGTTYWDLSWVYLQMGLVDRALQTIDSAVALEPDGPFRAGRALIRLTSGDTVGAIADARLTAGATGADIVLAAFAHDSAAIRRVETDTARVRCEDIPRALHLLWTGRREEAVGAVLQCGPSLQVRAALRFPALAPLADDPRIQMLRATSDSIWARARWR